MPRFPTITALALAGLFVSALPAAADRVVLTAPDGSLRLEGELLSHDGEFLRVDTVYGILTVDAESVDCDGAACPGDAFMAEVRLSGAAETGRVLMPALLEAFAAERGLTFVRQDEDDSHFLYLLSRPEGGEPVARVWFRVSTTAEGVADLVAEQADMIMAFRPLSADERALALDAGLGDLAQPGRSRILALDALVPAAWGGEDAGPVFAADIARALSGDGPVLHLADAAPEAALAALSAGLDLRAPETPALRRHGTRMALDAALAATPGARALVPASRAEGLSVLPLAGSCGATIAPDRLALKSEDYPLTAPHYIFTPARRLPRFARAFLDWLDGPGAQAAIRAAGFVDQALEFTPLEDQGARLVAGIRAIGGDGGARDLARMVDVLDGAARVSVTFRFDDGSADLDAPSRANVALLAREIASGRFAGAGLILAGFSDGLGGAAANRELSLRRAETVAEALAAALPPEVRDAVEIVAEGFGEALPIACDEDAWGRRINRRVEVWLRQR